MRTDLRRSTTEIYPGVRNEAGDQARSEPWPAGEESLIAAVVEYAASDARQAASPPHVPCWHEQANGDDRHVCPDPSSCVKRRGPDHTQQECARAFLAKVRDRILSEPNLPEGDVDAGLHAAMWGMLVS